jgi:hypothetical protein
VVQANFDSILGGSKAAILSIALQANAFAR